MLKGGYQIIDLENKNHEVGVGMVHEGIYDKIEGTRKAIMLSGVVLAGVEYHDVFVQPVLDGSDYVTAIVNPFTNVKVLIRITDTDVVTASIGE